MANFNLVVLAGNLTRDPVLSYTPSQTAVCNFGLAINRKWTGQDGQVKEEVCFADCTAFGKTAETISKYCKKGNPLLVEGRLHFSQWTKDEIKHSKLDVIIESMQFLGTKPQSDGGQAPSGPAAPHSGYGQAPISDDIPF